jgi:hypothetical protein
MKLGNSNELPYYWAGLVTFHSDVQTPATLVETASE